MARGAQCHRLATSRRAVCHLCERLRVCALYPLYAVQSQLAPLVGALVTAGARPDVPRYMPSCNSTLHVAALQASGASRSVRGACSARSNDAGCPCACLHHSPRCFSCTTRARRQQQHANMRLPAAHATRCCNLPAPSMHATETCRSNRACAAGLQGDAAIMRLLLESLVALQQAGLPCPSHTPQCSGGPAVPGGGDGGSGGATQSARVSDADAVAPGPPAGAPPPPPPPPPALPSVDLENAGGGTPLLFAAGKGRAGVAALLIKVGTRSCRSVACGRGACHHLHTRGTQRCFVTGTHFPP